MNKRYLLLLSPCSLLAQSSDIIPRQGWGDDPPELASLVAFARSESDLRVAIIRYVEDKAANGVLLLDYSAGGFGKFKGF